MPRLTGMPVAAIMLLSLAGCASDEGATQALGAGIGAGVGALAGSHIGKGAAQSVATAAGAALGAYIGGKLAVAMTRQDWQLAGQTQSMALESAPSGTASTWRNPDSGNSGTITVAPATTGEDGAPCRPFRHELSGPDGKDVVEGLACRNADGSWGVVSR